MKKIIYSVLLSIFAVFSPFILTACKKNSNKPYITSLEFYHYPTKTSGYKAYDCFDDDGLVLKANYSNGGFVIVQSGWTYQYVFGEGDNQVYHTEYFYGGESKIKINYENKSIMLNIDEVEKINQDLTITINEYSQIQTGTQINIPTNYISVKDLTNQTLDNVSYQLIYCKDFVDYLNYQPTTTEDGASVEGGAPAMVGSYKVFAKAAGDTNYKHLYSNVAEFNIIDETNIDLLPQQNEEFFAWKEDKKFNQSQEYIQFEIEEIDGIKTLTYNSSFAENGYAMIFSNHITLINGNEKVQIRLENNKILINNNIELKKWTIPSYVGTYQKTITTEDASDNGYLLLNDKICKLEIFVDEYKKDGKTYFKLDILCINGETLIDGCYEGVVEYSIGQNGVGSLSFQTIEDDRITNLFLINDISLNQSISQINIMLMSPMDSLSNGIYQKV